MPRSLIESNCICICFGDDGLAGRSCIGLPLSGDDVTGGASPKIASPQKIIEIRKRCERYPRRAEIHRRAGRCIKHPRGHHREDAGQHFDMHELP